MYGGEEIFALELGSIFPSNATDFNILHLFQDLTGDQIRMAYTVNGRNMGVAFYVSKAALGCKALYPHVLTKNQNFTVNFGQIPAPLAPLLPDFAPIGQLDGSDGLVRGTRPPPSRAESEVSLINSNGICSTNNFRIYSCLKCWNAKLILVSLDGSVTHLLHKL